MNPAVKICCALTLIFLFTLFVPSFSSHPNVLLSTLAGAAYGADSKENASEPSVEANQISDPLENLNHAFFSFNDKFYFWVAKPVGTAYAFVMPEGLRISIQNAFENIQFPIRMINCVLQGKMKESGTELGRFIINSTLGVGGLFDMATTHFHIPVQDEDTGQTLAVWGVGHGAYHVWPFVGPASTRDTFGKVVDSFLNPISYLTPDIETSLAVRAGRATNELSLRLGEYEDFKAATLDPYVSMRHAYTEHRAEEVRK